MKYCYTMRRLVCVGALAVFATVCSRLAAEDMYWASGDAAWSTDMSNWKLSDGSAATRNFAYATDCAVFDSSCTVTFSGKADLYSVEVKSGAEVAFQYSSYSSDNQLGIRSSELNGFWTGAGKIILKNARLTCGKAVTLTVGCDLGVDTKADVYVNGCGSIVVGGSLSGSCNVSLSDYKSSNNGGTVVFKGDCSQYTGTMSTAFASVSTTLACPSSVQFDGDGIVFGGTLNANQGYLPLCKSAGTYTFAALNGNAIVGGVEGVTLAMNGGTATLTSHYGTYSVKGTAQITVPTEGFATSMLAADSKVSSQDETMTVIVPRDETWTGEHVLEEGEVVSYGVTFTSGVAVKVKAVAAKPGDVIATFTGATDGIENATFSVISPNTFAQSPFYGTPTIDTESEAGKVLVKAVYADGAQIWCGEDGASFGVASNWKIWDTNEEGVAPSSNVACIVESDISATCLTGNSVTKAGHILLHGSLTLTSGNLNIVPIVGITLVEGPGSLVVNGLSQLRAELLGKNGTSTTSIYSDLSVCSDLLLRPIGYDSSAGRCGAMNLYGALTGDGAITVTNAVYTNNGNQWPANKAGRLVLAGDTSGFSGSITTMFGTNGYMQITGEATNLPFSVTLGADDKPMPLVISAGTYEFGSLSGKVTGGEEEVAVVTKATGATQIDYAAGSGTWTLENAGSAIVTVMGDNFSRYVASGTGAFAIPSLDGATVVKNGSKSNALCPALVVDSANVDLIGLNLVLQVPDSVSGWQYLVSAGSFAGDPTSLSTYVRPEGRDKYVLKLRNAGLLGATDLSGFVIGIR